MTPAPFSGRAKEVVEFWLIAAQELANTQLSWVLGDQGEELFSCDQWHPLALGADFTRLLRQRCEHSQGILVLHHRFVIAGLPYISVVKRSLPIIRDTLSSLTDTSRSLLPDRHQPLSPTRQTPAALSPLQQ